MSEHRAVCSTEHNPSKSAFHGSCRICLEAWPCPTELNEHNLPSQLSALKSRILELEAENLKMREALSEFGVHKQLCNTREMHERIMRMGLSCDCGLDEALAPLEKWVGK